MNICIITSAPTPPKEGIGNYIFNLSKTFSEKGHSITLITRGGIYSKCENIENINIIKPTFIPCYPFHVHFHKLFVDRIFKKIESKFDIVHIHTPLVPTVSTKLPIICTVHTPMRTDIKNFESKGIFPYLSKCQAKVSYVLEQKLFKSSDLLTAVSNSVANELIEEYGIKRDIKIIFNGVDESIFKPKYENGFGFENVFEENGYENKNRYILTIGRLTYRKGLFDLIESAKYICEKYSDIKFIVAGDGILRNRLIKMVKSLGIDKKFIFKGHVTKEELIKLYQNATIYVMASHYEGLPTVLLEAMSCGLPVVATAVSGNLDIIKSGENGILVPAKSPKDLANGISILLDDSNFRKKLGINARKTILENYTWKKISNNVMCHYKSLLV